jgi:purine-cytosine permease-like protein
MTGHVLSHSAEQQRQQVPFKIFFKAVFGFALAAILIVGSFFIFLDDSTAARLMLPLQIVGALIGAAVGAVGAFRAGGDASSSD